MGSQLPDRKNSPSSNNGFPSRMSYSQITAQNFMPNAPVAPLAVTLPLFYNPSNLGSLADNLNGHFGANYNVMGDTGSSRSGSSRRQDTTAEQFARMALKGCNIAEKIALNHKNRPCFKKIDSLCARLKQDLVRSDSVLANINSQGIAWAVKDMIFTFTRIVNAWIIVKGYMFEVPPGLNKVKQSCSVGFDDSFFRWQDATIDFLENLTDSFEKLDVLVQTQKNRLGSNGRKMDKDKKYGSLSDESRDDDFYDDLAQASVMRMLTNFSKDHTTDAAPDGGYFRTGIYNPLQNTNSNLQLDPERPEQMWEQNVFPKQNLASSVPEKLVKLPPTPTSGDSETGSSDGKSLSFLSEKYKGDQVNPEDTLILILLSKLYEMKDASLFFNKHFTKNYVPEYVNSAFTCKDTKTIMISIEKRSYTTLAAIVKDLGEILYDAKSYLKKHPKNSFLAANTEAFEIELKSILSEDIFSNYDFRAIFIDP